MSEIPYIRFGIATNGVEWNWDLSAAFISGPNNILSYKAKAKLNDSS